MGTLIATIDVDADLDGAVDVDGVVDLVADRIWRSRLKNTSTESCEFSTSVKRFSCFPFSAWL